MHWMSRTVLTKKAMDATAFAILWNISPLFVSIADDSIMIDHSAAGLMVTSLGKTLIEGKKNVCAES